jgi:tetratricopeptide (TPR) repeat protein
MPQVPCFIPLALLVAALSGASDGVWGQQPLPSFGAAPQARSQEEFDDWLEFAWSADARVTVSLAARFSSKYPDSVFSARVYQRTMMAHQELNDSFSALAAGRTALRLAPNNLHVLATVATLLANHASSQSVTDELLAEACTYARKVLEGLPIQKIPPSLPLAEWNQMKARLETSARAALGLAMLRRGETDSALRELEWVAHQGSEKDGVAFLRLGSAYLQAKNPCAAALAFDRAQALGPAVVRERAAAATKTISDCPSSDTSLRSPGTLPTVSPQRPDHQP